MVELVAQVVVLVLLILAVQVMAVQEHLVKAMLVALLYGTVVLMLAEVVAVALHKPLAHTMVELVNLIH